MNRALWMTVGAAAVGGVAMGLTREARTLEPGAARFLLLGLCIFLVFEWAAHLIGSRISRSNYPQADRAAFAALSSAGIWIVLLSGFPVALHKMGIDPVGLGGVGLTTAAAAGALCVRLWFLREIYEMSPPWPSAYRRAAILWAASRVTALGLLGIAVALWTVSDAVSGVSLPVLRIGP